LRPAVPGRKVNHQRCHVGRRAGGRKSKHRKAGIVFPEAGKEKAPIPNDRKKLNKKQQRQQQQKY